VEIDGFSYIITILALAKELHDIGRSDIVREHFFDTLCCDSYFENIIGLLSALFPVFYSNYDDYDGTDCMIFSGGNISRYYEMAWEYGRSHNVSHDRNPYVIAAEGEVRSRLNFCYSLGWKLLGYTNTKKTAKQSKLIVYMSECDCDCHDQLAYGMIQLYKFFGDKCEEFESRKAILAAARKEVTAA
jgi:hypothetical protein